MVEDGARFILVGAYERDNFGDLLFLHRTGSYVDPLEFIATAPFPGSTNKLLGQNVYRYVDAVAARPPDVVWVVGGEVGGTSVADAFRMSSDPGRYAEWMAAGRRERRRILEEATGMDVNASPYLPRMSGSESTFGTRFVINSAGLSGIRRLRGGRRDETLEAVREASYVSVRDQESSSILRSMSISHTLAPDLVHTIVLDRHYHPASCDRDLALVQVKGSVLSDIGTYEFARILWEAAPLRRFRIQLFSAGSAAGHDSRRLYEEVAAHFYRISGGREIEVSRFDDPVKKARDIARCGLWIGTSLHGLIIASSFDVPRVAVQLEKLVRYASTWDEPMPTGVNFDDIGSAIESALSMAGACARSGRALDLAHEADRSIRDGLRVVTESHSDGLDKLRSDSAARVLRRRSSASRRSFEVFRGLAAK